MNGFVQFRRDEDVDRFLSNLEIMSLREAGQIRRSRSQPLLTFRGVPKDVLERIRALAEKTGGTLKESTRYEPLS